MKTKINWLLILLLMFTLISGEFLHAQSPEDHEKKVYVDDEGEVYWNKHKPVYIKLSASPDGGEGDTYTLESDTTPQHADPYYFDTEGINFIRTQWATENQGKNTVQPKKEVLWQVYADGIAPQTSIDFGDAKLYSENGQLYIGDGLNIDFASEDGVAGLEGIYYTLNGATYQKFEGGLSLEDEKEYNIKFYGVDKVGNVEEPKNKSFTLDVSAPESDVSLEGPHSENYLAPEGKININSEDNISGVKSITYSLNDGKNYTYSGKLNLNDLKEGKYSLKFSATDKVDNKEKENTYEFYVDDTPPVLSKEYVGKTYEANGKEYISEDTKLKLTAEDTLSGVKAIYYSINGGEYKKYEVPFKLKTNKKIVNVDAYALDMVDNKSSGNFMGEEEQAGNSGGSGNTEMDFEGPAVSQKFEGPVYRSGDTLFITSETKIAFNAEDDQSGVNKIDFSINGNEESTYDGPFTVDREGTIKVDYTAYDNLINETEGDFSFVVDNKPPEIYPRLSIDPKGEKEIEGVQYKIYSGNVMLFLASTDKNAGLSEIYYSINDEEEKLYRDYIQGFEQGKIYNVNIRSLDELGNEQTREIHFAVEN